MLFGAHYGELEVRRGGGATRLRGSFPYGKTAVLSDGGRTGRPKKERIASRAFSYRVEQPDADIHLLVGHSYDAPLASKLTHTLKLNDSADALAVEATISPEIASTSYGRDAIAMIEAGLAVGISPGFRIPPKRAVADAETVEHEADEGPGSENRGAIIRTVRDALLFELSIVTVPAYREAQIEARNWEAETCPVRLHHALARWRV